MPFLSLKWRMISVFSDVVSPLRRQGYDHMADDLHHFPGRTFAVADQGLAVAWLPCWERLGRRRQLQVAMTFSSSPKTRLPESCPFSAGHWISIHGVWIIWAFLHLGRGNSIPASYLFQSMPSETYSFHTDEEN